MALLSSSRYTTGKDEATSLVIGVRKVIDTTVRYTGYVTREGDTFEILAMRVYRDPGQYWRIADLNPQIKFPDKLEAGTFIRLPS